MSQQDHSFGIPSSSFSLCSLVVFFLLVVWVFLLLLTIVAGGGLETVVGDVKDLNMNGNININSSLNIRNLTMG